MSDIKTIEDAREYLAAQKKSRAPKFLAGAKVPVLEWSDGTALSDDEEGRLISLLREEGPGATKKETREVARFFDAALASEWSTAVRKTWEVSTPAAHKWALFQQRILADDDTLEKLSSSRSWSGMASSGGSARARWYMEVFCERPSPTAARELYAILAEKFSGALHANATYHLEGFAKARGLDITTYLEEVGILCATPEAKLSFTPGKDCFSVDGVKWTVDLHQGALIFIDKDNHHRSTSLPTGAKKATIDKVMAWEKEVSEQSLRWGSYFLQLADRSHMRTLAEIKEQILAHPLGAQLCQNLVWRDDTNRTMRLTTEGAFDVEYEPVEISDDTKLCIVLLGDLDKESRDAWTTHMVDEEIVMPVDILSRQLYIDMFQEIKDGEDKRTADDLWSRTHDEDFHHGPAEDAGMVYTDFHTFADFNVRVGLSHRLLHRRWRDLLQDQLHRRDVLRGSLWQITRGREGPPPCPRPGMHRARQDEGAPRTSPLHAGLISRQLTNLERKL